jgi:phosphatidylglycerol lysyltransferase
MGSAERARQLVMAHGWNSTAYQILNPGMLHWFNAAGTAVIGYQRRGHYLLAAGAPVCPANLLPAVAGEFETFAREQRCRVCYVCAGDRLREAFEGSPEYSVVALGAQPVWRPGEWNEMILSHASLRSQILRARNKGVAVSEMNPRLAAADPDLAAILKDWLAHRQLPPLHFLVEPEVLNGEVEDRVVLVARRNGTPVAYLVASPIAARNGYLIQEIARSPHSPNGTSELLIDAAMRRFAAENRAYVTLGLVALARNVFHDSPLWLRGLMYFASAHANRFYNFRGLEYFRTKMHPGSWENIYLISRERRFSFRTLYAVGGAFSGISPIRAVGLGIAKAARQELLGAITL